MTTKQAALVTGANKGIGFETVRQLAQQGYTVWLGSRDQDRGEAAADKLAPEGDVRYLAIDVTDPASISAAVARIDQEPGALDILVNNAGIAIHEGEGRPSSVQLETIHQVLEVNFYGALRVTQAFLPLVKQASAGRIVNVSSTLGSLTTVVSLENPFGQLPFYAYPASKTFLNAITAWLALELGDTPIKVNSVCPGANATDMNPEGQHPAEGAKVVVHAATLPPDGPTGSFIDANGTVPW